MGRIWLRNIHRYAVVDDETYDNLSHHTWHGCKSYNTWYAACYINRIKTYMHRMILNPQDSKPTDHKNRNGLDNRKHNLVTSTTSLNALNSGLGKTNTSGYKGVSYHKHAKRWASTIVINSRRIHFGYFNSPQKAHWARKLFMKGAQCQFSS